MCFVEVACLVLGISILITVLSNGSFPMGNKELRGAPAYAVAGLLIAVLPIAVLIGCGVGARAVQQGREADLDDDNLIFIDIGAVAGCAIPALIIALVGARPKKRKKKKKRRSSDGYDDYDDTERDTPRRRRRLDEEEEEIEEQRPRRRRPDEDEEESPRRRAAADEDEDEPPRRRRRFDDDDEDNRPRRRRRDDDD